MDPDLATIHKAIRAAVLMPLVFVLADKVIGNEQIGLFAAFGSFALLVLTDVSGSPRSRLTALVGLAVTGSVLVVLGTLCARQAVLATAVMAVVGFVLLLAGAMSPLAAMTTTAALLTFILPVSISATGAVASDRLAGWLLAVVVAIPAQMLVWPPRWHDRLRASMGDAIDAVHRILVARAAIHPVGADIATAIESARAKVAALQWQFESTPYRPTTSAGRGLALAKLVDDLEWLRTASSADSDHDTINDAFCPDQTRAVWLAADRVLDAATELLATSGHAHGVEDAAVAAVVGALDELGSARRSLMVAVRTQFTRAAMTTATSAPTSPELVVAVGASLNARRVANATELVGRHILLASGLDLPIETIDQIDQIGSATTELETSPGAGHAYTFTITPATQLESFASVRSVWFRSAARGALGLALAVAVAKSFPIQHGFWVVLGTLSVLRSNAVGTGASALRALVGTFAGFVIAAVVLVGIGHHPVLLWVALPVAVLAATVAPVLVSFAAGQAGFTVVVVILFNLIEPTGWHVGLVRVEDVALGCAISVVVGLLCWPRGASGAFGGALGDALSTGSGYLLAAVDGATMTTVTDEPVDVLHRRHLEALTADRRLDDAFRLFVTERAVQRVGLDVANRLVSGTTRIRLAAYSLASLRDGDATSHRATSAGAIERAGRALHDAALASHRWYEQVTVAFQSRHSGIADPPATTDLTALMAAALDEARDQGRTDALAYTLGLIWTERHLMRQSLLQHDLADQAEHLLSLRRGWWS